MTYRVWKCEAALPDGSVFDEPHLNQMEDAVMRRIHALTGSYPDSIVAWTVERGTEQTEAPDEEDWDGHISPSVEVDVHLDDDGLQRLLDEAVGQGRVGVVEEVPGYHALRCVLDAAYDQAASGKGKERHALDDAPFEEQPMQRLIAGHGLGFATGQACKKAEEALSMSTAAARRELLGAIVYLAGAVVWLEEQEDANY